MRYDREMDIAANVIVGVLGLVLGSFAGAQVWRLRAAELASDESLSKKEQREYSTLKYLRGRSTRDDRSVCLSCHHALAWYDLIPVISWFSTSGRCRYCHQRIGWMEPLIEITTSAYLVMTFHILFIGEPMTALLSVRIATWIAATICIAILFWYDLRWSMLPLGVNLGLIASSAVYMIATAFSSPVVSHVVSNVLLGAGIAGGLYWLLYAISRGRWVGGGDYKLAIGLALLLGDWRLALAMVFAANLIGCIVVLPALLQNRKTAQSHIAFGPFLIAGFFVVLVFSKIVREFFSYYLLP